ncbi:MULTISPECIES: hypothetical protein [unclassified Streptomyces]|uniref:hypothetical protein n=1 Tax=unclassified Streptomyces TaxID=2593676 RepID=UPI0038667BD5|nr:hypothetical protein OG569_00880 [Streptomyces sp. NBC_00827]
MAVIIGLLSGALVVLVGAITTYVTTRSNMLLQLEHSYDVSLRDRRLERYQKLFHLTRSLPRYWPADGVPSRSDLLRYRDEFHEWYFGEEAGGMYLTPKSKSLYMAVQNSLFEGALLLPGENQDTPVSHQASESILRCASELRHQLAEDVGVAQPPRLRWGRVGRTEPPPGLTTTG